MSKFQQFSNTIQIFKEHSKNSASENSSLLQFQEVINELKTLSPIRNISFEFRVNRFSELTSKLRIVKKDVYSQRLLDTKSLMDRHPERLKISSFELMEHNFRENTHSNILQFLFDYEFNYNAGPEALFNFSNSANDSITELKNKLLRRQYVIKREKSAGSGRIDLLIYDNNNKFVIVIENKLLADISVYETEDEDVTESQLDNYKKYIDRNFTSYEKLFILLSFKVIDDVQEPYKIVTYRQLYDSLRNVDFGMNSVFDEYQLLLHSLINNIYDKKWLIKIARDLNKSETHISVNILEQINKLLTA